MMFANSLRYNTDRKSAVVKMTKRLKLWFKAGGLLQFLPYMLSSYIDHFFVFYCRLSLHFSVHHSVCLFICVSVCLFPLFQLLRSLAFGKFTLVILFFFLESLSYCLHRIKICDSMKIRIKKKSSDNDGKTRTVK